MPYSGQGLWYNDQNTKIPAVSHVFSFRVSLPTVGTTATIPLPDTASNPAQVVKTNPLLPYNQPQQSLRLFPFILSVRDPSGVLAPTGTTGGGTVALVNQASGNSGTIATLTSTPGATSPLLQSIFLTSVSNVPNPYDQLAITFTQATGATSTAAAFTVDFFGAWQQGV